MARCRITITGHGLCLNSTAITGRLRPGWRRSNRPLNKQHLSAVTVPGLCRYRVPCARGRVTEMTAECKWTRRPPETVAARRQVGQCCTALHQCRPARLSRSCLINLFSVCVSVLASIGQATRKLRCLYWSWSTEHGAPMTSSGEKIVMSGDSGYSRRAVWAG